MISSLKVRAYMSKRPTNDAFLLSLKMQYAIALMFIMKVTNESLWQNQL